MIPPGCEMELPLNSNAGNGVESLEHRLLTHISSLVHREQLVPFIYGL